MTPDMLKGGVGIQKSGISRTGTARTGRVVLFKDHFYVYSRFRSHRRLYWHRFGNALLMTGEAGQTPFDQRLFLIFMVTFAAMTVFEFTAQFLYPYPPDWRSNIVTSLFTSGLAVAIAYFPLNAYYSQSERLLAEREKNRAVEAELRESEEKFRTVVENTLDGIMIAAPDGTILYSNRANAGIFDITRGPYEPGSKNIMDFLLPSSGDRAQADFRRIAEGIDGFTAEYPAITATGRQICIEILGKRVVYRNEPAVIISVKDITARKQMEQAVLCANKKLSLLSSITRHDINNQLQALNSYVGLLRAKNATPENGGYFSRIDEASGRITSMIQFTREYEEVGVSSAAWQNLHGLVTTAAKDAAFGGVAFENDLPADVEVFADPLVARVFFNLIDNALRHGGRIRTIRVFLEKRGRNRVIVCEDDGDGVVPDEKERIFLRGVGKNTGFGLAISREILDITRISINETGEYGRGARFEMVVPEDAWRVTGPAGKSL